MQGLGAGCILNIKSKNLKVRRVFKIRAQSDKHQLFNSFMLCAYFAPEYSGLRLKGLLSISDFTALYFPIPRGMTG